MKSVTRYSHHTFLRWFGLILFKTFLHRPLKRQQRGGKARAREIEAERERERGLGVTVALPLYLHSSSAGPLASL